MNFFLGKGKKQKKIKNLIIDHNQRKTKNNNTE